MPKSWIAIDVPKFAVKSAYGFATDTSKLSPVDPGPRRGQGYASGILDTWNRANLHGRRTYAVGRLSKLLLDRVSTHRVCFRFLTLASPLLFFCLTYFPSPPIFLRLSCHLRFFQPSFLHNWNRCSRAISTSVSTGRK